MTENLPAILRPPPVKVNLSEPLTDLDQAMRLADALSKSTLVPDSLAGKPASVLHVILTGQALDLHWTEALRVIYSPGHGQIGMRAQFLLSQLRKAGHKYSGEYSDDGESYTFTLTRKDEPDNPYTAAFSRQDAIDAKLISKDNWVRYFKRMLRARAITDCVSFAAPEVLLGFMVEGDEDGVQPVQLQPTPDPAPPEPAGEAAPGGQAAQAGEFIGSRAQNKLHQEHLRKLDAQMREEAIYPQEQSVSDPEGTVPQDFLESPAMGGNPANEETPTPYRTKSGKVLTEQELERLADEAEAGYDIPPTAGDAEAPTVPSASSSGDEAAPDASAKAKKVVLSEWFTRFGYDPKVYRAEVLRACSVYTRRRITGTRDLKATEVMHLSNELSGIFRREDELAPVSRLADEVDKWENAWRYADPEGYAIYEEGR